MNNDVFHFRVIAREGVIYEDKVRSISSFNESGKFDVLSQHANFITLVRQKVTVRDLKGKTFEYSFNNALIKVLENDVKLYLGIEGIIDDPTTYPSS